WRVVVCDPRRLRQSAERGHRADWPSLLRPDLYRLPQAIDPAEHRHRRRRRSPAADGGLDRGDRTRRLAGALPLRGYLLLDAAPLLGPVAAHVAGLRPGKRSDAAAGGGRGRDPAPDFALFDLARRGDD